MKAESATGAVTELPPPLADHRFLLVGSGATYATAVAPGTHVGTVTTPLYTGTAAYEHGATVSGESSLYPTGSVLSSPVIAVTSLEGLVGVAIDTDNRVIEDAETGRYYDVADRFLYAFEPPTVGTTSA